MSRVRVRYEGDHLVLLDPIDLPQGTEATVELVQEPDIREIDLEPMPELSEEEIEEYANRYGLERPLNEAQVDALRYFKWVDSLNLPPAPGLPLEAYDREHLYP